MAPRQPVTRVILVSSALLWLGLSGGLARAETPIVHVVRPGETLASIAERYYGDPKYETVLVAENALNSEGGSPIVVGLRLRIPTVSYHRVEPGETWPVLAQHFYGDSRRAFVLLEANGGAPGEQPDDGAELIVPYPLRHVVGPHDNLRALARTYFGRARSNELVTLRRFNFLKRNRLQRGQIILVPLAGLRLSEPGKALVEEATGTPRKGGDLRARQLEIDERLPLLREHVRSGRFAEAVAMGGRLLGQGELTGNQIVTIQRVLGTAFVALGRDDLATQMFLEALERQPFMELDTTRTSPKVLAAFQAAKVAHERTKREADDAGAGHPPRL